MLSRKEHRYERKRNKNREKASIFSDRKNCTNLKDSSCHTGFKMCKVWTNFTTVGLRRFIGLHDLNSTSTSPRVEMKFKTQVEDPANGNDLCSEIFGSNALLRLKMFRCLFSVQDPRLKVQSKHSHPNFKIDPWMLHLLHYFV